jgi:hypothetical protein
MERKAESDRQAKLKSEAEAAKRERESLLARAKGSFGPETVRGKGDGEFVAGSEVTAAGTVGDSDAAKRRRSTRGGRGRRSLLTSSAGGMGYFSRFL